MGNGKCIICEGVVGTEEKISQIKDMNVGRFKNNKYSESNQKIKDHTFIGGKGEHPKVCVNLQTDVR